MAQTPAEVVQRILTAFGKRELPKLSPVFMSRSVEVDTETIERVAHQTADWHDIPQQLLRDNSIALAFATPTAFAWLLPAFVVLSITRYAETGTLTNTIVSCLTPPDDEDSRLFQALSEDMHALDIEMEQESPRMDSLGADEDLLQLFRARAAELTNDERAAIRDYLEYVDVAHGVDFPVLGPRQALDRYWILAAEMLGRSS